MILSVSIPRGGAQGDATVHRIIARPGDALRPGSALLELRVDLGAAKAQDCPPVLHLRVVATERAQLRSLHVAAGDAVAPGAPLGVATTTPDEPADGPAARTLRTTSVTIHVDPLAAG